MNRDVIEGEVVSRGLTTPRVKPEDLDAEIASVHYFTALQGARMEGLDYIDKLGQVPQPMPLEPTLGLMTFCVLVLKNGFKVSGDSSCVSHENFDELKGRQLAFDDAREKLWPLLGFRLKDKLERDRLDAETIVVPTPSPVKENPYVELGQQLHFFEQINGQVTEAMLALVTGIPAPGLVNVSVFAPNGTQHPRMNVRLLDLKEEHPLDVMNFARVKP